MDAATNRTAPTTVKTKCHQLQLNCLFTATAEFVVDEHPWKLGHVVLVGIDVMTVLVKRLIVQSTHIAQSPTTTTMRKG
jgi:hypothetical protein